MNLFTKEKQTHRLRKQTCSYQREKRGRYKQKMDSKVLLYSTRNYIQNPVINHKEKNIKKEYIYNINIDITESLCYIP